MLWVLGITDTEPRHWQKNEPCWEDEVVEANSTHTFHQLAQKLCETALSKRRNGIVCGVDDHMWSFRISSYGDAIKPRDNNSDLGMIMNELGRKDDEQDSEDDEDSEEDEDDSSKEESKYRSTILVAPRRDIEMNVYEEEEYTHQVIASNEVVSQELLQVDHVLHFRYDFGSTSNLYLKVLRVRTEVTANLLQCFDVSANADADEQDLRNLEAYKLPKELQIDTYYSRFSKAFIGEPFPLKKSEDDDAEMSCRFIVGSSTLGLSCRISRDDDTMFCTIENSDNSSDLFNAVMPFSDINEFLEVSESAWVKQDDHRLYRVNLNVFPSGPEANECYAKIKDLSESPYALYGPKMKLFRLEKNRKKQAFDFAEVFPKTNAQFKSGKFRWIKYKNNVLRVIIGRGIGYDNREFSKGQVLRTWRRKFTSFHELLCAVEASWVYKKQPLDATIVVPDFDTELGPSKPGPKEPPVLGKEEDVVPIAQCSDSKKCVLSMAMAKEKDGSLVLYSGHADGTLTKWSLVDNRQLWSKQAYTDLVEDFPHFCSHTGIDVGGTAGVAGLVVRVDEESGTHSIFTWTHAFIDEPSQVNCWLGIDGGFQKSYSCDIGLDEDGDAALPSIATVVFCRVLIRKTWVDTMVVGLHCICATAEYKEDYSDYDIKEAKKMSKGNILPFLEHSDGKRMSSWRAHNGMIRAMAVIPHEYLLSLSIRGGHGFPDAMILWSLRDPGVPLCRYDLRDPTKGRMRNDLTRLHDVCGISVHGYKVLFAVNHGDKIAAVTIRHHSNRPLIRLRGYGNIGNRHDEDDNFHGVMAMCGEHAAMSNEATGKVWLFDISTVSDHDKLDRRKGSPLNEFRNGEYDEDDETDQYRYAGREIAIGKVLVPLFGVRDSNKKKRKVPSWGATMSNSMSDIGFDEGDGFGDGGPMALAMAGNWLVVGFANGSIVKSSCLPDQAAQIESGLVSHSTLPSDEWDIPVLDHD